MKYDNAAVKSSILYVMLFFFFQAEDGIRDDLVTGVQTCALPIFEGDVTDQRVGAHVAGHDAVVHLAAQSGVPPSLKDPRRDCEVNVLGTLNLLEAARELGVGRFVFASSNAPLGRQPPPATEATVALPASPYG